MNSQPFVKKMTKCQVPYGGFFDSHCRHVTCTKFSERAFTRHMPEVICENPNFAELTRNC